MSGRITESGVLTPWLRTSQAREYLQIDKCSLLKLINSGTIPSIRRGNTRYVHTDDLDAWMRSHPSGATSLQMSCS